MIEYLVRWKFAPNSLLNHRDFDTHWYKQFHPDKEAAIKHYTELCGAMPEMKLTAEVFMLTQLMPGDPDVPVIEPRSEYDNYKNALDTLVNIKGKNYKIVMKIHERNERNKKIVAMYTGGYSRTEIAKEMNVSYQTVYAVTRKYVAS